jgi:hypothetical protein
VNSPIRVKFGDAGGQVSENSVNRILQKLCDVKPRWHP